MTDEPVTATPPAATPPDAAPVDERTTDQIAAENDALRSKLEEQNAQLRAQVTANADATSAGLSDEEVRRIEQPGEFA